MNNILTSEEAAEYIKVAPITLEQWRMRKDPAAPPYYKPMGKIYYLKEDLDNWIKSAEQK